MSKANTQGILPIAGQDNPNKLLDALFIHGLGGDAFSTWQLNDDEEFFWPKALNNDLPDTAIWTIGYGATATSWIEDVMPMQDRVENLLNQLTLKNIGQKPFFLITHSMGGLIAKYLLTQAAQSNDEKYKQFATQCAGIIFLAVPHDGAGWSNILDYARVLFRGNKIVAQIAKDDSALRQLDKNFGQFCQREKLDCRSFYETKEVRLKKKLFGIIPLLPKGIKVVSESSAISTFLTTTAVPLDDDHLSICKISSKEDLLYLSIIDILKDSLSRISKDKDKNKQPDKPEEKETPKENPKTPPIKEEDETLFLLFHLKQQDNKIISINENAPENITPIDDLLPFNNPSAQKQAMATALFGDQNINEKNDKNNKTKIRIRIMTDDPQLAMLPWHCLETKQFANQQTTIEISPITLTHHSSFISYSPNNPLCVIPANPSDGISSDSHYHIIEENFKSYFDIKHNIPRVSTASQLQREIGFLKPDIIYIYARFENETILLDIDTLSQEPLTLDQLAQWLNDNDLKPLIILSLIGEKISDYPKSLVENSHLLWIQQTRSKLQANTNLSNNIAHVFNLSNQNPDIIHAIQKLDSSLSHEISHHHWIKGRSIKIDMTDPEQSGERQLRAALLRIMLGRENIKNALHGQIFHSDIINNSSFLSYVVTGNKNACPFDFPAQLQQRLQYEDINHSLKVIPFYFNIDVKPKIDAFDTIETALSQGILHESNDITEIFHKTVSKYDECCISLNWLLKVSQENQDLLNEWLIEWRGIQCHWFANKVPDQTVLLSAVCIQIEEDDNNQALAQKIQERANEILEETASCQMEAIYIEDALGTLKAQEINSFLRKNPYWQEQLKLDQNNIDLKDYANWVYKQEKGKFDPSVRIIWQQSQDNYQKYLESS